MTTGKPKTAATHGAGPPVLDARPAHVLLIMVDGLGLPPENLSESIYAGCPALCDLITRDGTPVDAGLGVAGIPQSATGQTAILTGVNAASLLGGHREGFPNAELRGVIEKENLFLKLQAHGRTCTFANAYVRMAGPDLTPALRSVTTVSTLSAFGKTRTRDDLLAGRAVYHDVTRLTLIADGFEVPPIGEAEAARHLLGILRTVDFCLFEFFLTDHAGHRGSRATKERVLATLDRFLGALVAGQAPDRELLLLVSDHGNIEDDTRTGHTANPVPWIARGCGAAHARTGCRSILEVTPRVLHLLTSAVGNVF